LYQRVLETYSCVGGEQATSGCGVSLTLRYAQPANGPLRTTLGLMLEMNASYAIANNVGGSSTKSDFVVDLARLADRHD